MAVALASITSGATRRSGVDVWIDTFYDPRPPFSWVTLMVDAQVQGTLDEGQGIEWVEILGDDGFWAGAWLSPPAGWVFLMVTDLYTPLEEPVTIRYAAYASGWDGWGYIDGGAQLDLEAEEEYPEFVALVDSWGMDLCGTPNCTEGALRLRYELMGNWGPMKYEEVSEEAARSTTSCVHNDENYPRFPSVTTDFIGRFDDVVGKCLSGCTEHECCPGLPDCLDVLEQDFYVQGVNVRHNHIYLGCWSVEVGCFWGCVYG